MNEFMDFRLVIAMPAIYDHCHGYAACGLPATRPDVARARPLFGRLKWPSRR